MSRSLHGSSLVAELRLDRMQTLQRRELIWMFQKIPCDGRHDAHRFIQQHHTPGESSGPTTALQQFSIWPRCIILLLCLAVALVT